MACSRGLCLLLSFRQSRCRISPCCGSRTSVVAPYVSLDIQLADDPQAGIETESSRGVGCRDLAQNLLLGGHFSFRTVRGCRAAGAWPATALPMPLDCTSACGSA